MKLELHRVGVPSIARRDDGTWKKWAYDEAVRQQCGQLEGPVWVTVTPFCPDKRGISAATSYWQVTEQVLDGLISAGVLASLDDIREVTLTRTQIGTELAFTVTIVDVSEPF